MGYDVNAAAKNYDTGVSGGGQKWVKGVQDCKINPMQKAASQVELWKTNTMAGADKFVQNLTNKDKSVWTNGAVAAQSSYTGSSKKGAAKQLAFHQQFQPVVDSVQSQLESMPRGNIEQNLARSRFTALA